MLYFSWDGLFRISEADFVVPYYLRLARNRAEKWVTHSRDLGLKELGGKQWVISEDTSVLVDLSSFYEGHDLSWGCSDVGVKKKSSF
jgi:hypothetical protein